MISRGETINDRYQIIRTIGEGGMANVYLAHDIILDRDVAVKVLRGDLAGDEKFVRRFQREAISASSLSHPNIVEMYDVGEDNGKYFIVMEYVEGKTLKSLIKRRGALTLSEVIDIMMQLTSGLACAHESYIIHRDIKPQNVLILDDGRVKITDFGIAMALNSNELTQTNSVMGSVHYLPPEQANGATATIKSDIYSTGILMYELLTGKIPFKGENAVEIAIKQMKDPIPSVREQNSEIPQSIENIILKATAKNPKNRYENVMEMHSDLVTALDQNKSNEPKIVFQYPEYEIMEDENKKETKSEQPKEKIESTGTDKKERNINMILLITGGVVTFIVLLIAIILLLLPAKTTNKEIEIPNVSGMTVERAEKALEKLGFKVKDEVSEKNSDKVEAGNVIETSPKIGRTVKEGTTITLIVSKGKNGYIIENYIGQNYHTVKATLEANGLKVELVDEEHTEEDGIDPNIVIAQDVVAGTELKDDETIKLTIPKIVTIYPDFTASHTIEQVRTFCTKNKIKLEESNVETNTYNEGKIISQSILAGTVVGEKDTLKVVVAIKPVVVKYTVTFMNDSTKYKTLQVESGNAVSAPANPTKDGYNFVGWYNGAAAYNFQNKVTNNLTLTAKWEKVVVPEPTPEPTPEQTPTPEPEIPNTGNKEEEKIEEPNKEENKTEEESGQ